MDYKMVTEKAVRIINNTPIEQREEPVFPVQDAEFSPLTHELLRVVASRNNVTMSELLNTILNLVLPQAPIHLGPLDVLIFENQPLDFNWEFLEDAENLEVSNNDKFNTEYGIVAKVRAMAQMLRDFLELHNGGTRLMIGPKVSWFPDPDNNEFIPIIVGKVNNNGTTYVVVEDHEGTVISALSSSYYGESYRVRRTFEDWPRSISINDYEIEEEEYGAAPKEEINSLN